MSSTANVVPLRPSNGSQQWKDVLSRVQKAIAGGKLVIEHPSKFRPMAGQPREYFDEGAMQRLIISLREVGQIQMGLCRPRAEGKESWYEILDGERRWRGVSAVKLDVYRSLAIEIDDEAAPYMVSAIANFNRQECTPTEVSDAIQRLHGNLGVPIPEVAKMFGLSEHYTYQLQGLQNLHQEVRALLDPRLAKDRVLPTTAAIQIAKMHPDLQLATANRILDRELSIKGLRQEVVRVSEVAGRPVITREVRPDKQLRSIENTVRHSVEEMRTVRDRAKDPTTSKLILEQDPRNLGVLIYQLEEIVRLGQETLKLVRK